METLTGDTEYHGSTWQQRMIQPRPCPTTSFFLGDPAQPSTTHGNSVRNLFDSGRRKVRSAEKHMIGIPKVRWYAADICAMFIRVYPCSCSWGNHAGTSKCKEQPNPKN